MKIRFGRRTASGLVLLSFFTACQPAETPAAVEQAPAVPKRVILMIGDGMGLSQVSASLYYNQGKPSNFERFTTVGLIKTSSSTHKITDSAAGATAFSTGKKSFNGAIGVGPDSAALPNITELLAERNFGNGLVATSSITHATPASFYARAVSRKLEEEIAAQLPDSRIAFFAGGGLQYFFRRSDGTDQLSRLREKGFRLDTAALPAGEVQWESGARYGYLLAPDGMPRVTDGRGDFLPRASRLATDFLAGSYERFFLMIEGSQIDWGGHANDAEYLISEQIDFDAALGVILDFAEKDGNTLVIVTADHETGGFTLASADTESGSDYDSLSPRFSTGGHSAAMVPVFAYGPGAENFSGIYENTDIFRKVLQLTKQP